MKRVDYIRKHKDVFDFILRNGIVVADAALVGMYDNAKAMIEAGEKRTYVGSAMADKYHITDRTYRSVMKRLDEDVG